MRRVAIFTAGAALVVGSLAIPGMAVANGRSASRRRRARRSRRRALSLDNEITALGKGHGKGHSKGNGYRKGYRRGYRHGHSHSRFRHGYGFGYGYGYWPGGFGYRGLRAGQLRLRLRLPGYWRGGFGCNFDYPCGPPFDEQCRSFRGAPSADPKCQARRPSRLPASLPSRRLTPAPNLRPLLPLGRATRSPVPTEH